MKALNCNVQREGRVTGNRELLYLRRSTQARRPEEPGAPQKLAVRMPQNIQERHCRKLLVPQWRRKRCSTSDARSKIQRRKHTNGGGLEKHKLYKQGTGNDKKNPRGSQRLPQKENSNWLQ